MDNCLICERINQIKSGTNPYFVLELNTGYVVLGDFQFFKGYTLFLCKKHCNELHKLEPKFRWQYLKEMSLVAEAVFQAFKPNKLNYELLGNSYKHLHWHIFPRHQTDPRPTEPVWVIEKAVRQNNDDRLNIKELSELKKVLLKELTLLI